MLGIVYSKFSRSLGERIYLTHFGQCIILSNTKTEDRILPQFIELGNALSLIDK